MRLLGFSATFPQSYHYDPCPPLKIRPLIHKIVLTGDWDTAKLITAIWEEIFAPLYKDNDYKPEERKSLYTGKMD